MNVKQARFDRSILRLLGIRGACALVALGLLGIHSAEGRPRVAVTPGEDGAAQGFVQSVGYLPCEQRRDGVAELGLYVRAVTDQIEVIQRDERPLDLCGPRSSIGPMGGTGIRNRERPVPPD